MLRSIVSERFLLASAVLLLILKCCRIGERLEVPESDYHDLCPDSACTKYCAVELKGYSTIDTGLFIKVNSKIYTSSQSAGLLLVSMLPGPFCRVKDKRLITSQNSMTLAKYFGSLPLGAVVFGVTGGGVPDFVNEASGYMKTSLLISVPGNLTAADILSFQAMKGHASYAKYVVSTQESDTWHTKLFLTSPQHVNLGDVTIEEVERNNQDVIKGKGWTPLCSPRWRVAIIVPFRDRQQHLNIFLNNLLPLLKKQLIRFHVFLLDQSLPEVFNRAALMNVGYLEARKMEQFDCYVFHDVDHIPEDVCNLYSCSDQPRHLSVAKDINNYRLVYHTMFGGASLMSDAHIRKINGFPNTFFGWGGEDDNIFSRLHNAGYTIARYPSYLARYTTIPHQREHQSNPNAGRGFLESLETARLYWRYDGLNSVNYTVLSAVSKQLYTHLTVRLPGPVNAQQQQQYFDQKTQEFAVMRVRDQAQNHRGNAQLETNQLKQN